MYNIFNEGGSGIKKNNNKNKKKPKGFFTIPIFLFVFVLGLFFPLLPIQSVATYAAPEAARSFFTDEYKTIYHNGERFIFLGHFYDGPERDMRVQFTGSSMRLPPYNRPVTANDFGYPADSSDQYFPVSFAVFLSENVAKRGELSRECNRPKDQFETRFIPVPSLSYLEAKRTGGNIKGADLFRTEWETTIFVCGQNDTKIGETGTILGENDLKNIPTFLEWANCTEGPNMMLGSVIIDRRANKTFNYKSGPPGFAIFEDSTTGRQISVRLVPGANSCTFLPMNGILLPNNITVEIANPNQIKPTAAKIEGVAFINDAEQATGTINAPNLPIVITSNDPEFEKTINTDTRGRYSVLLPCGNEYTIRIDSEINSQFDDWLKNTSNLYDAITVDDLVIGASYVSISDQASGCVATPSGPIDIPLRLESRSPLEKAMTSSISIMMGLVNFALSHIGEWINSLLIGGNEIERTEGLEAAWNSVRNMTLSLLTLLLLLVAFANILSINMEQYGLVKIIPKIIVAIILAYFSLLISSFLLDLMSALQSLLVTGMGDGKLDIAAQTNSISMGAGDIASGVIEQLFLLFIGLGILFTAAWLALLLIVRNAMLLFLVAVSPLAFLCNILPFTEKYYKQWWASFWKWMFIGPAVLFMLWLAGTFLGSYQEAKFLGEESRSLEGLFWLTATAVMIALAALLPLKMGGEIYGQIQKIGNRAPGVKGIKDTYGAFKKGRGEYKALKTQQRAENIRAKIGRVPYLGGIAAGTRGVFSQDFGIAKKVYAAEHKEDTQQEAEEALNKEISRGASLESPRVVALLEKIAGEFHSSSLGADTQKILASAVAEGLNKDENGAPNKPILLGVTRKLEQNPNKDAAVGLYAKAIEKGYLGEITYANNLRDLAVRKASNKTVPQSGRDDLIVIKTSANAGHTDAINAWQQIQSYAASPDTNREDYVRNTPAKTKAEHESIGFKLGSPNVVLGNNQQQNAPRPNPKPNGPSGNVPRNR